MGFPGTSIRAPTSGGGGVAPDAGGPFSNRSTHDSEAEGFIYRVNDGTPSDATAGTGTVSWDYIRQGSSGNWIGPFRITAVDDSAGVSFASVERTVAAGETKQIAVFPADATILRFTIERTLGGAAVVGDKIVVHDGAGRLMEWECTSLDPVEKWTTRYFPDAEEGDPEYYLSDTSTVDANSDRLLPSESGWRWVMGMGDALADVDMTVSLTSAGGELTVRAKWAP